MTQPAQKPGLSSGVFETPAIFIHAVRARLGISDFTFDFAADAANCQGRRHWDEEDDSLSKSRLEWAARVNQPQEWGWLNPPFAKIEPWAKRCRETKELGGSIAFLVPAAVGSNWFRDHVDGHALVLLLNGRLAFMPDKPKWLYPKDCILCLYSPRITPGYEVWNWRQSS